MSIDRVQETRLPDIKNTIARSISPLSWAMNKEQWLSGRGDEDVPITGEEDIDEKQRLTPKMN